AQAGRPFAGAAGHECRLIERVDRRARGGVERNRHTIAGSCGLPVERPNHPERVVPSLVAFGRVARRNLVGVGAPDAERRERGVVETQRARELRRADRDVAEHGAISRSRYFRSSTEYAPAPATNSASAPPAIARFLVK